MLSVLFVDDEPFIMKGLSIMIDWESYGYKIIGMAGNAMEALEIIESERPDLVIADVRMPQISGLELLERVHQKDKEISFVMLSGYSEFEYVRKALTEGCVDYLLKPINEQELIATLKKVKALKREELERRQWTKNMNMAPLFRFFKQFNPDDSIDEIAVDSLELEENKGKKVVDELIHAVEVNQKQDIVKYSKEIYRKLTQADDIMVNLVLNYILFELLNLATNVDGSIDRQEVLQFISDSVLETECVECEENSLEKVMVDYSEYLCELRGNQSVGVIGEVENYLKSHYFENITLKDLGKKYYVNSAYLGQMFKKQFGESFKDYLNQLRIQKAEEFLIYSDKKIYEIANEIGYKDIDYFINKFISIKGCTPAKFRKQMK